MLLLPLPRLCSGSEPFTAAYFFNAANIRSTYCCDGISQLLHWQQQWAVMKTHQITDRSLRHTAHRKPSASSDHQKTAHTIVV